jgi:2-methylfumaryl-CoA isomerase
MPPLSGIGLLSGLRVVEGSAFIAAPLGGMTLAQLGADVVRFDPVGGGVDYGRWPLAADGQSLYWAGFNKGKRSIQIDLGSDEGRELAAALVTAPGEEGGLFLTNLPSRGPLSYKELKRRREDLIMVSVSGNGDGSSELDYTANAAAGFPLAHGPRDQVGPVNAAVPAWDMAAGMLAAVGILAAERRRARGGGGELLRIALSDVAFAMAGHMGRIAEASLDVEQQPRDGNYVYGAFGNSFETGDGRWAMVVAITARQWTSLRDATEIGAACAGIEAATGADLETEAGRYAAREAIAAILRPWFASHDLEEIKERFRGSGVCWGPYQTFRQMLDEDPRCSPANPIFEEVEHPGVGSYLMPGSPLRLDAAELVPVTRAPLLGEHTEEILTELLDLSGSEIGRLYDSGTVAGPSVPTHA